MKERDKENLLETLATVPLFSRCEEHHLQRLVRHMKEKVFKAKDFIMKQNEVGKRFYIIVNGLCDVIINDKSIGKLSTNDYCGELALIQNNGKRSASIQCIKTCRVFWIDKATFKRVLQNDMKIIFHERKKVVVNEENDDKNKQDNKDKIYPSDTEIRWLLQAVQTNVLFRQLTLAERRYVISRMYLKNIKKGEILIKEGENGDNFYVIRSGRFKVFQESKGLLRYVTTRDCIGELALIYNSPRSATIQSVTSGKVWVIDRSTLRYHVKELNQNKSNEIISFLKNIDLFKTLVSHEFLNIADGFREEEFEFDQKIIGQGEVGTKFYLIKEGYANVFLNEQELETNTAHRKLKKGDYFGERSLLCNENISATIISASKTFICYTMTKKKFENLLGPLEVIMKRHMSEVYNEKSNVDIGKKTAVDQKSSSQKKGKNDIEESNNTRKVTSSLQELIQLGRIGVGGYGVVNLVRDPNTSKIFALKCVRKDLIVWNKQQKQIQSELNVMKELSFNNSPSEFIINLYSTYKDKYKVYFLIDVAMGGDLFHYMRTTSHNFSENEVKFYIACVVEAFEYIHKKDIIYRDLKPENLVIMDNGYIKLTDMGLAKQLESSKNTKTYTMCGTPDYLAPETLLGRGHTFAVDYWALGILIYELIGKVPPFMGRADRIADKILSSSPKFNYLFSINCQDIISQLLVKNPLERLKDSYKIKKHNWFSNLDWQQLQNKKIKPPYVPKLNADDDLSNFKMSLQPDPSNPSPIEGVSWEKDF